MTGKRGRRGWGWIRRLPSGQHQAPYPSPATLASTIGSPRLLNVASNCTFRGRRAVRFATPLLLGEHKVDTRGLQRRQTTFDV